MFCCEMYCTTRDHKRSVSFIFLPRKEQKTCSYFENSIGVGELAFASRFDIVDENKGKK